MIAPTAAAVLDELAKKDAQVLNLLALCRTPEFLGVWSQGPELFRRLARLLLRQNHPTLALEVAARGLDRHYPDDHELLYCRALALARSGNATRADQLVKKLLDRRDLEPQIRSDALALAGRGEEKGSGTEFLNGGEKDSKEKFRRSGAVEEQSCWWFVAA